MAKEIKKSNIYTKTGDQGTSSLYTGERRTKAHAIFNALGDVDELNSALGLARAYCVVPSTGSTGTTDSAAATCTTAVTGSGAESRKGQLVPLIEDIQCALLEIGSSIGTPRTWKAPQDESDTTPADQGVAAAGDDEEDPEEAAKRARMLASTAFDAEGVRLAALEHAIDLYDSLLPRLTNFILPSGGLASSHLHLARSICRRAERAVVPLLQSGAGEKSVGKYLNRLSDFLFVAARFAAQQDGQTEVVFRAAAAAATAAATTATAAAGKREPHERSLA
ncbi:cobalamin adenosyltransferase [Capsaspora owczarzaki ATCC 30864]|uniref:Cobalamin adenosyltransferase n=1 Tax=Capsaspora owczarzaki (strain ATCC 30864) TaxID=595528 RepID=A0A0D2X5K9_CAPO3|nr:cobalamin adenosyltransferase [Capsaspora owczarzaki ATCC 30864]KJE97989.1 cobalamin adenosyltransferase [Capsaspora owczarzaki ATCC 30864]|eukprot:XP_004342649.2 cobalamin adenosyltransferase [Capsaspora owczarzaki ATCC 30864]